MQTSCFDVAELVELRQHIHKHAEISNEEFNTSAKIREFLLGKGVNPDSIKACATTGLVVDIKGKGEPVGEEDKIVAFRADIDALEMKEENFTLPYRSITKGAHMCFHDGHLVCLLGGIARLLDCLDDMPSNRTARFLFQPAEEKYGGAHRMVSEGCLKSVAEIWGMHCYPYDPPNSMFVKEGVSYAGVRDYNITVYGKGGHSSLKKDLIDPLIVVCDFKVRLNTILETEFAETNEKLFTVCFPKIKASDSNNVIAEEATVSGVFRFTDIEICESFDMAIKKLLKDLEEEYKVKITVKRDTDYPVLMNHKDLVDDLVMINPEIQTHDEVRMGADDFAVFCTVVPGCYFKYYIGDQKGQTLHSPNIDFNDSCIEKASENWSKIISARLDIKQN